MVDTRSTKNDRREAARVQAVALKQEQLKKEARARAITLASILAGLVVIGALVAWIVLQGQEKTAAAKQISADVTAPAVATDDGAITFGKDKVAGTTNEGTPTVAVYFDFMCPACGSFEERNGTMLDEVVSSGQATLALHPTPILDNYSQGTEYSTRAASAFAYLADKAPESAWGFFQAAFDGQPAEGTTGLTDEELSQLAADAGAAQEVVDAIAAGTATTTFRDWVTAVKDSASATSPDDWGRTFSTPTVLINGQLREDWSDSDAFRTAVLAGKP